ncbi:MAG TPA: transcriptional regulator [Arenibaculum sp.]|nr:transcriptional regulator [Arenibaculum sp.]
MPETRAIPPSRPLGLPHRLRPALLRPALLRLAAVLACLAGLLAGYPAAAAELVMFEEPGCPWCAAWHARIGPIYPKTPEGRRAPLRRVDMTASRPDDLRAIKGVVHSPTFVLVDDGREIGRILGYPGEDFFWALLGELMGRLDAP